MYAYDAAAMAQASQFDPFRVAHTLEFAGMRDVDDVLVDADTILLEGPRGAAEFASMWAYYRAHGIRADKLDDCLSIVIGEHGRGMQSPAAQRQMLSILRWLLACAGYGEDVLQDAIVAALIDGACTVGAIMAHTPYAIETRDWARREPQHSTTPIEWLE